MSALFKVGKQIARQGLTWHPRCHLPMTRSTILLQKHTFTAHETVPVIQEHIREERPLTKKYTAKGIKFENFEKQAEHFFEYIYSSTKHLEKLNWGFELHFLRNNGKDSKNTTLLIQAREAGTWQLHCDDEKNVVLLVSPLKGYHAEKYKYDEDKDEWVNTRGDKHETLLMKLYIELDGEFEGYPHYGLEDTFRRKKKL